MPTSPKINLSSGHLLFCESLRDTSQRRSYLARFVRAGRIIDSAGSQTDIEILPEALSRAAEQGKFNQCAVFVDHASVWESPSLKDLIGVTANSTFDGDSIYGDLILFETPLAHEITDLLDDLLDSDNLSPDIGLSIVFYPVWRVGNKSNNRQITEIHKVESVDLVFQPAAGGRILAALSAQHPQTILSITERSDPMPDEPQPLTLQPPTSQPEPQPSIPNLEPSNLQPVPVNSQESRSSGSLIANDWLTAMSASASRVLIASSGLPAAAQTRLASQSFTSPVEVERAIDSERAYLASLQQDSVINLAGRFSGMLDSLDRVTLAFDALMAGRRPEQGVAPLSGIRELYHLLSGDYEMSGLFHEDRLSLAAVTSSTMASLVANVLNKRLAVEFQQYPKWWEPIVTVEDFSSLQNVSWITLGGVGELPTVAEGAAYTEMTWDDKAESAAFVKKGGYLGLTLEAIDKDDVGRLRAAPRALAQAAWLTLSKSISAIFTSSSGVGPTMSDSQALFHANHGNLGTTALSVTELGVVRTAMRKQTELNSGERLGALTAWRIISITTDYVVGDAFSISSTVHSPNCFVTKDQIQSIETAPNDCIRFRIISAQWNSSKYRDINRVH